MSDSGNEAPNIDIPVPRSESVVSSPTSIETDLPIFRALIFLFNGKEILPGVKCQYIKWPRGLSVSFCLTPHRHIVRSLSYRIDLETKHRRSVLPEAYKNQTIYLLIIIPSSLAIFYQSWLIYTIQILCCAHRGWQVRWYHARNRPRLVERDLRKQLAAGIRFNSYI
jgi:hypothetical protein